MKNKFILSIAFNSINKLAMDYIRDWCVVSKYKIESEVSGKHDEAVAVYFLITGLIDLDIDNIVLDFISSSLKETFGKFGVFTPAISIISMPISAPDRL